MIVGPWGLEPTTRGLKERPSQHSLASPGSVTSANAPTRALVRRQLTPFRVTIDVTRSIMLSPALDHLRDLGRARRGEGRT
jgi:hypothetical protein